MSSSNRCKKFQANIFDKSKCQNCYRAKEQHCAEALESNRASRKISKCGYLFVAPEQFDFNSPLDKTRRWQRRFIVLYDDGELTYSVDENVSTVPQGVIDMNGCTDVFDAEELTTHALSIAVKANNRNTFIKGTSKEEINRWHDVLVFYPRSSKTKKNRRPASLPATKSVSKPPPLSTPKAPDTPAQPAFNRKPPDSAPPHGHRTESHTAAARVPARQTRRHSSHYGTREPRTEYRNGWSDNAPARSSNRTSESGLTGADSNYYLGMGFGLDAVRRKKPAGSSLQSNGFHGDTHGSESAGSSAYAADVTVRHTEPEAQTVSNGHRRSNSSEGLLDSVKSDTNHSPLTFRGVRSMKHGKNDKTHQAGMRKASSMTDLTNAPDSHPGAVHSNSMFRSVSGENLHGTGRSYRSENRDGERSFQVAAIPVKKSEGTPPRWPYTEGGQGSGQPAETSPTAGSDGYDDYFCRSPSPNSLLNCKNKNETDELKMAKSNRAAALQTWSDTSPKMDAQPYQDDLMYMKKGWLLRQEVGKDEWIKQWFVLRGTSLYFHQDARAEELGKQDGSIDITSCYQVVTATVSRNYGFTLKTSYGEHTLSAMTSGIRANWMQAIQKCIEASERHNSKTSSQNGRPYSVSDAESARSAQSATLYNERAKSSMSYQPSKHMEEKHDSTVAQRSLNSSFELLQGVNTPQSTYSTAKINSEPPRRSRARSVSEKSTDPNRKFSCTWPYTSPSTSPNPTSEIVKESRSRSASRSQQPRSRSSSRTHSRRSSVTDLIDDEEFGKVQKELTEEEERELDNVEVNIRRIHRKSITDSVAISKLPHLSKFEQNSADRTDSDHTYSRASRELFTAHDARSREQSPARRDSLGRSKSPTTAKPPSVKLKDKSRSKSPKRRSPPPNASKPVTDDYFDSLEKWKENRLDKERSAPTTPVKAEKTERKPPVSDGQDNELVELLDSEVESLRRQLEHTKTGLKETESQNASLKSRMESLQRDHSNVIGDIDADNDRYMGQLGDLQSEMDHATDYLKNRLVEQENRSGLTKIQVNSLKKEVIEAKDSIRKKEDQIQKLHAKLEINELELKEASAALKQSRKDLAVQKSRLQKGEEELSGMSHSLENMVKKYQDMINAQKLDLKSKDETIKSMQTDVEEKCQVLANLKKKKVPTATLR